VIRVFVYGSLKPGEENYNRYCQGHIQSEVAAIAQGHLYDLPGLGYPAMTPGPGFVHGYVLSFEDPALLDTLDWLEEYEPGRPLEENEYYRVSLAVIGGDRQPLGQAWCYLMVPERVHALGGVRLASGQWSAQSCPPEAV